MTVYVKMRLSEKAADMTVFISPGLIFFRTGREQRAGNISEHISYKKEITRPVLLLATRGLLTVITDWVLTTTQDTAFIIIDQGITTIEIIT